MNDEALKLVKQFDGNPMTLRSQIGVAFVAIAGLIVILSLLRRRRISEGLFYLWMIVFAGILIVGLSHRVQAGLAKLLGTYEVISTMLLLSLAFLFGASLVYSILLSNMSVRIRDLTSYIAEIRLDVDDLQRTPGRGRESEPPRDSKTGGGGAP